MTIKSESAVTLAEITLVRSTRLSVEIQTLHGFGLLSGSFRPADAIVVLRGYLRQRQMLVRSASRHVQHMRKALEQMNLKLTEVVSHTTGKPGMEILRAMMAGERDPKRLSAYRNEHCKINRRMRARLGAPKPIVATARKLLARLVYAMLTRGEAYVAQAMDDYERSHAQRRLQSLLRQAKALGYRLEALPSG